MGNRDRDFITNMLDCAELAAYTSIFITVALVPPTLFVLCLGGAIFGY